MSARANDSHESKIRDKERAGDAGELASKRQERESEREIERRRREQEREERRVHGGSSLFVSGGISSRSVAPFSISPIQATIYYHRFLYTPFFFRPASSCSLSLLFYFIFLSISLIFRCRRRFLLFRIK